MSENPSREEIITALKESGYLMEQEVATQLETLGYHVTTNAPFEDKDEGKSREMDVKAVKRIAYNEEAKISAWIEIIAECKNTNAPFVFIGRPKNKADNYKPPLEFVFPTNYREELSKNGKSYSREWPAFFHLGFDKIHKDYISTEKAVQFCRLERKKGWSANHGGLYDSLFYPMAKAISSRVNEVREDNRGSWKYFWFFIPMIIVNGEIYYVDSTNPDAMPEERNSITFKRELKAAKLKGNFTLDFVKQNEIENFIAQHVDPLISHAQELITQKQEFILKQVIQGKEE